MLDPQMMQMLMARMGQQQPTAMPAAPPPIAGNPFVAMPGMTPPPMQQAAPHPLMQLLAAAHAANPQGFQQFAAQPMRPQVMPGTAQPGLPGPMSAPPAQPMTPTPGQTGATMLPEHLRNMLPSQ